MKSKVLHVITRLDAGGSATNTLETVARLDKEKYDVRLISGRTCDPDGSIAAFIQEKGINCVFVDSLCREINLLRDIKAFCKLYKFFCKEQCDIVHTHSSKAGILGRWAAKLAGVKYIVHTPHGHVFYGYFNKFISKIFISAERLTARITDKIITLTDIGRDEHLQFKIAELEKFRTIYSGVDWESFLRKNSVLKQYRKNFNLQENQFIFGTVARLESIKGNEYLVGAMAEVIKKYPETKLLIVGEGSLRNDLEKKSRSLNLEKYVIFTGHQTDAANFIHLMDVFVLASLNEGMGRVILEAMACRKPVIASRTGGIPELVKEGQTGLLVNPGDSNAVAEAMIYLYENREEAKVFGEEGRRLATDMFSLDKMIKDIDDLYQELGVIK